MVHEVTERSKHRRILARLPLLASLLLLAAMPFPPNSSARTVLERAATEQVNRHGFIPLGGAWQPGIEPTTRTQQNLRPTVRTWLGEEVLDVRLPTRPAFTLPQSRYGDAVWNPVTDEIHYDPFPSPTPFYFTGTLHLVTGGNGSAFTAACAAAADTDIVEIRTPQVSTSLSTHVCAARGTPGYVLVRDQATYSGLPAWNADVRVDPATHLATANVWSSAPSHQGAALAFDDDAEGYVFWGIRWQNGTQSPLENVGLVATGPLTTNSAETGRQVFQHCSTDGMWTLDSATRRYGRRGFSVVSTGCKILDSDCRGHVSASTDSNCINGSSGIGEYLQDNCGLESASETIIWGGSLSVRGAAVTVNQNIRTTRCFAWRRNDWNTSAAGMAYSSQKNNWETKNAQKWLIDRCVNRNYQPIGQQYIMVFKAVAQGASDAPHVASRDITVRYCAFDSYRGGAFQFAHNYTGAPAANRPPATQCMRNQVYGCRFRSIPEQGFSSNDLLMTPGPLQSGTGALGIPDCRVERNTFNHANCALDFGSGFTDSLPGLVITDNVFLTHTRYIILASQAGSADPIGVISGGTGVVARNLLQAGQYYSQWPTALRAANFIAPSTAPIQYTSDLVITDARYNTAAVDGGPIGIPGAHFLAQIAGVEGAISVTYSV